MSKRRKAAFTREELYKRVWSEPLTVVAKSIGISSNALTKICNRLLVPCPPRGYWAKKNVGKTTTRPPLPEALDQDVQSVTIGGNSQSTSRHARTRLGRAERQQQLIEIAEKIIGECGLHAASMKRIAALAGISETQAYNYFRSRDELLVALARREFAHIRAARQLDIETHSDHYGQVLATTRTYLRLMSERGGLLQTLLSSPELRRLLRQEHRQDKSTRLRSHAQGLVDLYGIPRAVALGCTAVLTTVSLRTGKLISDKRISLESGERLCLSMLVQGSRDIVGATAPEAGTSS